jgi:hypothetical protein
LLLLLLPLLPPPLLVAWRLGRVQLNSMPRPVAGMAGGPALLKILKRRRREPVARSPI